MDNGVEEALALCNGGRRSRHQDGLREAASAGDAPAVAPEPGAQAASRQRRSCRRFRPAKSGGYPTSRARG
eukprot:COSAG04_NODE_11256_length_720_cov_3.735910_1_plen_70_part_10